jgi:death-on-curing protein
MNEPIWIHAELARAVQLRQVAEHGGIAGVRDAGLLESAMARPRNVWAYGEPPPDLAALAAAYAFGIARNHPFHDRNEAVALVVLQTFLRCNGNDFVATKFEKFQGIRNLAAGTIDEQVFADWIRHPMRSR